MGSTKEVKHFAKALQSWGQKIKGQRVFIDVVLGHREQEAGNWEKAYMRLWLWLWSEDLKVFMQKQ